MHIPLFIKVLPVYLIISAFFVVPLWQQRLAVAEALSAVTQAKTKLATGQEPSEKYLEGQPTRIVLPRLGIDLAVDNGGYNFNSKTWNVSRSNANFAQNTAKLNTKADKSLVYGHWTPYVFGRTTGLVEGDEAYVYTDNGHIFSYKFASKKIVKPTDSSVFEDFKGTPGLVLMTCEGAWAQDRRLMFFELREAA